jgi:toxin ParE1/3/4
MLKIVRTPAAVRDLAAITDHIAADSLTAALRFYDELDRLLTMIAQFPELGEAVDHLSPGLRRITVGNYLVFYRQVGEELELIRVLHGARDIDRLF